VAAALDGALCEDRDALVEERIVGAECTVPVLGNCDGEIRALTAVEICPHEGRFFDYEEKYQATGAEEFCPPRSIDPAICDTLSRRAIEIHRHLGLDGYSRSDWIVPEGTDPATGEAVFLEVNTLPGLTARSLFPLAAAHDGLEFPELCRRILALALA